MAIVRGFAFPDELYYLVEANTWGRIESDGMVTVGVTSYASVTYGEFLAFVPKRIGTDVEWNRGAGVLEMNKTIGSIRTPVAGVIVGSNDKAEQRPALINRDPYQSGWLVKIRPARLEQDIKKLVTGADIGPAFDRLMYLDDVEEGRDEG
jgi:glycine cleavage system H protein